MRGTVDEFIRRFLIHVLPKGFHRIRHYGLFAGGNRAETIETAREFLNLDPPAAEETAAEETGETDPAQPLAHPCPCCGGRMFVIETFEPGRQPRHRPTAPLVAIRIDTSMIGNTISRIIVRVSRWSSTGNAAARPESPASHVTLHASPKHSVRAALSNPITRSGVRNHKVVAHRRRLLGRRAAIKSP